TGKSLDYIQNDICKMIQKGWFLQGHLDDEKTCLITSHDTYRDYLELKKQNEQKKMAEEARREKGISREAESLIEEGRSFVDVIRECSKSISDAGISEKIARIEEVVDDI